MSTLATPRGDAPAAVHDMSLEDLRREYISQRSTEYSLSVEETHLQNKIEVLREESVRAELSAEIKEEQVSNQLFRRLDGAEKEVQRYRAMLKEEESEAEALTARIKEMRDAKNEVENALEERQEYLLMNLQRKLLETARKKTEVEQELMLERQRYLDVLVTRLDMLRSRNGTGSCDSSTMVHPLTEVPAMTPAAATSAATTSAAATNSAAPEVAEAPHAKYFSRGAPSLEDADTAAGRPETGTPEKHIPGGKFIQPTNSATPVAGGTSAASLKAPPQLLQQQPSLANASLSVASSIQLQPREPSIPCLTPPPSLVTQPSRSFVLTPSNRPSLADTPRSGDLTPRPASHSSETHHAVVALELKLNQLLLDQAAAMQQTTATERQCAELGAKLRAIQETTFLDRARAAKLKEELKEARARLAEVSGAGPSNSSIFGDSSFDDNTTCSGLSMRSFDSAVPLTLSNLSLRERTRELLSSVQPPSINYSFDKDEEKANLAKQQAGKPRLHGHRGIE